MAHLPGLNASKLVLSRDGASWMGSDPVRPEVSVLALNVDGIEPSN